jgi:hypothetical protein
MSIVSIRDGVEIRPPGEPNPAVVEQVERLLEMARSGELSGIAAAICWSDECTSHLIAGKRLRATIGELEVIKYVIVRDIEQSP